MMIKIACEIDIEVKFLNWGERILKINDNGSTQLFYHKGCIFSSVSMYLSLVVGLCIVHLITI